MFTESDLESIIRTSIGIPERHEERSRPRQAPDVKWNEIRRRIAALHAKAGMIGSAPKGYPIHVTLIIRMVAAMLPWYTRSLREFASGVSETLALMTEALAAAQSAGDHSNPE